MHERDVLQTEVVRLRIENAALHRERAEGGDTPSDKR